MAMKLSGKIGIKPFDRSKDAFKTTVLPAGGTVVFYLNPLLKFVTYKHK